MYYPTTKARRNMKEEKTMKSGKTRKMLALVLAMTMIMASSVTVFATGTILPGTPNTPGTSSSSGSSHHHKSGGAAYAATSSVATAAGSKVTSTVYGSYAAESVPGVAFTTPSAEIVTAFGLAGKPYAVTTDFSGEASPAANVSLKHGVAISGAKELGPVINMNLAQLIGGRVSEIKDNGVTIPVTIGIPASFQDGVSNYAVIRVRRGGIVDILPDQDLDPATVSVPVTPGTGVYAIIKY